MEYLGQFQSQRDVIRITLESMVLQQCFCVELSVLPALHNLLCYDTR